MTEEWKQASLLTTLRANWDTEAIRTLYSQDPIALQSPFHLHNSTTHTIRVATRTWRLADLA